MRKAAPLLAASLLSACSFAPEYRQPVAPVPADFAHPVSNGVAATDIGWRDYFADPRLQAYIAAALANNRDLAQAVARIDQARAQYRIQNSERLPAVSTSADVSRTQAPLIGLGLEDGGTIRYNNFSLGVAVTSFELDFWGRVRNLSEAARAQYLSTVAAERAFRLSLISQVAATYISIRSAEERIALAERSVEARREGLRIAGRRLDAGVTSTIDYDQAALLVTQAETELADLRRTTEQSINLLTVLVGGPIDTALPASLPLSSQEQIRNIDPGMPSALLENRPDILAAEQQLRAANANIGAARAAFFPTISLTGAFGFLSGDLGSLFDGDSKRWQVGGGASLPLLDWGRRRGNVQLTEAQRDELVASYQMTVQQAFREVADALVARQRYAEQIAAQEKAVEAQRRLARAARLRYDNGISIYLEVLDAERNLFAAEQQLLALRAADLQNNVSLYVALGGGLKETRAG